MKVITGFEAFQKFQKSLPFSRILQKFVEFEKSLKPATNNLLLLLKRFF